MRAARIKAAAALLLMVLAFVGAQAWRPHMRLADTRPRVELETLFPKAFGGWAADERMPVQLVSPDAQAILNKTYNQTLSRNYVNRSGDRIMLSVAYGGDQSDGTRAHRPEVCYPVQGFQITSSQPGKLWLIARTLRVRLLVARQGGRNEPITYWTTVGERIAISGTEQKLAQLSYSTRGIIPDGMLIRVSTIDLDGSHGHAVQARFIADLFAATPSETRPRLFGSAGGAAASTPSAESKV